MLFKYIDSCIAEVHPLANTKAKDKQPGGKKGRNSSKNDAKKDKRKH